MKPGMHALSGLPAGLMQRPYRIHLALPGQRPEHLGEFDNRETNDQATNQPQIEWLRFYIIVINLINLMAASAKSFPASGLTLAKGLKAAGSE